MANSQNIHEINAKALSAGLAPDALAEAAAHLCRLRGVSPAAHGELDAAINDITKYRQIEMAIDSILT